MRSSRAPIGIDIGGQSLQAVQISREGERPRIASALSVPRPTGGESVGAAEAGRLADILERQGFRGRRVVLAVPSDSLLSAVLELPPRGSGAPLDQISRAELAAAHKHEPDTIESAYWELPPPARPRTGTPVMVVGCVMDVANDVIDPFENAGLAVIGLEPRSCAITRACKTLLTTGGGLSAVLDIAWSSSSLVVVRDGVVVYERVLPGSGLGRVHDALTNELGLDADVAGYVFREIDMERETGGEQVQREILAAARDRLTSHLAGLLPEVRMSLSYAAQEYGRDGADRLLLVGDAACIPGMAVYLTRELGVDVMPVALDDVADCSGLSGDLVVPSLTVALGLALHSTGDRS